MIQKLFDPTKNFQSVTLKLHEGKFNLGVVRELFDSLICDYPRMQNYLTPVAENVINRIFQSGIYKVCLNQYFHLTTNEKASLQIFEKSDDVEVETEQSYADNALAAKKGQDELYVSLNRISPTSNIAEIKFSQTKVVASPIRSSLTRLHSEGPFWCHSVQTELFLTTH